MVAMNQTRLFELFECMNYGRKAHILDAFVQNICHNLYCLLSVMRIEKKWNQNHKWRSQ